MLRRTTPILIIFVFIFIIANFTAQAWSPRIRLTWNDGFSLNPVVIVDSSNFIHVAWEDYTYTYGTAEILYKKSTDMGTTWSAVERLTWNSGDSVFPNMDADSNDHLHVVWYDSTYGNDEILYKKSTDSGNTWSPVVRLTWNDGDSRRPAIAIGPNDNIHVVWDDDTYGDKEIFYKRSTDGGNTWSAVERLTWTSMESYHADVAVDSSNQVRVVWNEMANANNEEIMFKRSQDDGLTWDSRVRLTYTSKSSYKPHLAINVSKVIFLVWYDRTPGNFDIYFKKSQDGGQTWSSPNRLTYSPGDAYSPCIHVDSPSILHVAWVDTTPGVYEIYYKGSTDSGSTWSALERLTWNYNAGFANSGAPSLTADDENRVRLVWADDSQGSNHEIYFKRRH